MFITRNKEEQLFTKAGYPRQSKNVAEFIRKNAVKAGLRMISSNEGYSILRVDFESGKNGGRVKYFKVSSKNQLGQLIEKVEYFAE